MAHANNHTESARIRTILEISAFNLATLEYQLVRNAYVPESTNEQKIKDATYRFYTASTTQPAHFTFQRVAQTSSTRTLTAKCRTMRQKNLRALKSQRRWPTGTSASLSSMTQSQI